MSNMRQALLISAALLLTGAVVAVAVTAGCGTDGRSARRTPDAIGTGDIILTSTGDLDDLPVSEARVGDEIMVTGSEWTNIGPVGFYLLTGGQREHAFNPRDAVRLGEITPAEDGAISFRFRLAESYETRNGDRVEIEEGQRWYVAAYQRTEPPAPGLGGGSHGTDVGPLTVVE